jgi:hypothetical protein
LAVSVQYDLLTNRAQFIDRGMALQHLFNPILLEGPPTLRDGCLANVTGFATLKNEFSDLVRHDEQFMDRHALAETPWEHGMGAGNRLCERS